VGFCSAHGSFLFAFGSGSAHGRKIGIGVIMPEIKRISA
jgi:hypothetical protein